MTRAIEFILSDAAKDQDEGSIERLLLERASSEIIGLRNRLAASLRRNRKLDALEASGVDNWEWYGDAMAELHKEDDSLEDD